jgi:ABC-2 type transport system ATP-binding protein
MPAAGSVRLWGQRRQTTVSRFPLMPAIETTDLTKQYGDTVAVTDLDLAVDSGSVFGFLGPNGAGKTTTMRMLTGLVRPTRGRATVAGADATDRDALRPRIGYLPEEPPLYDHATAYEQLDYAAGLRDLDPERASERVDDLLDRLDLPPEDASGRIADYSKGMRQKVAYVQAVLHEPDVVFLDEPTSGLDPRAARTLRELIVELADGGTTVFLSTHILPVVEAVADAVGILYDGELVAEGAPAELKRRAETGEARSLEDAFLELTTDAVDAAPSEGDG